MFKVPDWEEDVPKSNIKLKKTPIKTLKQQKNITKTKPKKVAKHVVSTPKEAPKTKEIKIQAKKRKLKCLIVNNKKKKSNEIENNIDVSNVDIKQIDEVQTNNTKIKPKKVAKNIVPTAKEAPKTKEMESHAKKRKLNEQTINNKKKKSNEIENDIDVSNVDIEQLDEVLLNAKKKKFYEPMKRDDVEQSLFQEDIQSINKSQNNIRLSKNRKQLPKDKHNSIDKTEKLQSDKNNSKPDNKLNVSKTNEKASIITEHKPVNNKKENLRRVLQLYNTRNSIKVNSSKLRQRMLERLKAAQFRYINEKLYTSSGKEAKQLFQSDPAAFQTYHQGYQQQVKKWPVNPLDVIVNTIERMPKTYTIADMGCGEAALSKRIPHKVRSFDLVSTAPGVEICDMAHTPLLSESIDVTVFCLALMGTELTQYLVEANRVLKMGGHLLIAEVESRFNDVEAFTKEVMKLGFKLKNLDKTQEVFFFMKFIKVRDPPVKKSKLPLLTLKPCLYKRR